MDKINIELKNCYGINKLEHEISFENSNVNLIYAKNGSMKTSFAKTFKDLQNGEYPKEEIQGNISEYKVEIDGIEIKKQDIFVIKSFEKAYESKSIAQLLVKDELKNKLSDIYKKRDEYLKYLKNESGLKLEEVENKIITDFESDKKTLLRLLENIDLENIEIDDYIGNIKYNDIFKAESKITNEVFQSKIGEYLNKSSEIYGEYIFLKNGKFSLNRLKNVEKQLKKENFFYKDDNKLIINGINLSKIELETKIKEIEEKLKETDEFKKIEDLLKDVTGTDLKEIIENNPAIIGEFKDLKGLYKKLWQSYFLKNKDNFDNLKKEFKEIKEEIKNENIDQSKLDKVVEEFNTRFFVPFRFEIENKESVILGESIPKVVFKFNDKSFNIEELEKKDTLSQGEKRALYILNILFDVEARKGQETLFIVDDIADSFDYKNKYAIIEYLKEILEERKFYMIILTHNFDFFRTVQSRLLGNGNMQNCYIVEEKNDEKKLQSIEQKSLINPFKGWKKNIKTDVKNIISLIPFVRNLIEYGNYDENDFVFLISLLHKKNNTETITFGNLKDIFKKYLSIDEFGDNINLADNVFSKIINLADGIDLNNNELGDKIILALAIRLKAEEYMIKKINDYKNTLIYKDGKRQENKTGSEYLNKLENSTNQTAKLFDGYIQIETDKENILKKVMIMTPENIHINSFMYEPILDMDIAELKQLYSNFK